MNEKIYKTMGRVGGGNIAMGAVLVVVGVATGVLMIVSGAGLLKRRGEISEARAPMRYAGVSDSRGENNAERGNEDEAGDESQNPRCGTDFISGVSSCARLFSAFCRRIREKKLF